MLQDEKNVDSFQQGSLLGEKELNIPESQFTNSFSIFPHTSRNTKLSFNWRTFSPSQQGQLPYIAALDGLKGLAVLAVLNYNWFFCFYDLDSGNPYKSGYGRLFNLPILKSLSNSLPAIALFFIIYGYMLSYKPLKIARTQQWQQLQSNLVSSAFRRLFRLYIPCFSCLLVISVLSGLGINENGRRHIPELAFLSGRLYPKTYQSVWDALHAFSIAAGKLINPWTWEDYKPIHLDGNMWIVPVVLRASIVLFLVLSVLLRVKRSMRLKLTVASIAWAIYGQRNEVVLFLIGSILADLDIEADHNQAARFNRTVDQYRHNFTWAGLILASLYLCSSPSIQPELATGYKSISWISSKVYFLPTWLPWMVGSTTLVYSATRANHFHKLLTSNFLQYLGNISFSLYIIHGFIIRLIAYNLVPFLWQILGRTPTGQFLSAMAGYVIALAVVVPAADAFTRWVDEPSVQLSRWIESHYLA